MAKGKTPPPPTPGLLHVEAAVRDYRRAFDVVADRVTYLDDQVRHITTRRMPGILAAVESLATAEALVKAAIEEHPDDFVKPRSLTMHGIKVGMRKGSGALSWDDADAVVEKIKALFPAQADVLIATQEKPVKDALNQLSVADLKRLGCTVEGTGDVPFVAPLESNVMKLVKALLKKNAGADDGEKK